MTSTRAVVTACAILALLRVPAEAQTQAPKPVSPAPPATPAPFPEGARVAFIVPDRIIADSALGKSLAARVNNLRTEKLADLTARNKELEAAQQKLASGAVLSEPARVAAQKAADRLQVELQRAQQDAEAAIQELQQQVNVELDRAVTPLLAQVATDKKLHLLLRADAGAIAWASPDLDLTAEVVRRLDAMGRPIKRP